MFRILVLVVFVLSNCPALSIEVDYTCLASAYFAPKDDVQTVIVKYIDGAKRTLNVSAFGITNKVIADALVMAKSRGVKVQVGLDRSQSRGKYSQYRYLFENQIPILVKKSGIFEHNKYIIRDSESVFVGSTNFSVGAMKQDNSSVILEDCQGAIHLFEVDFERIWMRDSH